MFVWCQYLRSIALSASAVDLLKNITEPFKVSALSNVRKAWPTEA